MRYDVHFEWDSSHGQTVKLLSQSASGGVLIDIGCGYAPHAEPLRERGFEYIGIDIDERAVGSLRERSFEAVVADLNSADSLRSVLDRVGRDKNVHGVLALDVLEHLVNPHQTVEVVARWMKQHSVQTLAVSVPNVSHGDLPRKLLNARWDLMSTGLLDETHLRFFTDSSLQAMMDSVGLVETGRRDVRTSKSDQFWPANHPTVSDVTPLGMFLRSVRARADDHGETLQFIRAYSVDESLSSKPTLIARSEPPDTAQFLSVLIRPGTEAVTLGRLVAQLGGQSDQNFEVIVSAEIATSAAAAPTEVRAVDGTLDDMLVSAVGDYFTVLDGCHSIGNDWVEQFRRSAILMPGQIVRCASGSISSGASTGRPWPEKFDLVDHLTGTQTPSGALAFPAEALRSLRVSLVQPDGVADVQRLLVELAPLCGVTDSGVGAVTVVATNNCVEHSNAAQVVDTAALVAQLDGAPLLLGMNAATRLLEQTNRLRRAEERGAMFEERLGQLEAENEWLNNELGVAPVRVIRRLLRRPAPKS